MIVKYEEPIWVVLRFYAEFIEKIKSSLWKSNYFFFFNNWLELDTKPVVPHKALFHIQN